ncbi:MAG: hypothetical protein PHT76_07985 [Anaerostipes sp.]|nr:hypothetical protein [Anaerostipes sp.]
MFDWNRNGKKDLLDRYIDYKVYQDVMHEDDDKDEQAEERDNKDYKTDVEESTGKVHKILDILGLPIKVDKISNTQFVILMFYMCSVFCGIKALANSDVDLMIRIIIFLIFPIPFLESIKWLIKFTKYF